MSKRIIGPADPQHSLPMVVALSGPPGSGKSTTIRVMRLAIDAARDDGVGDSLTRLLFFDLEKLEDKPARIRALTNFGRNAGSANIDFAVFGTADVGTDEMRTALTQRVLLISIYCAISPHELTARASRRNAAQPDKRGQTPLATLGGFTGAAGVFDLIVEDSFFPILRTLASARLSTSGLLPYLDRAHAAALTEEDSDQIK